MTDWRLVGLLGATGLAVGLLSVAGLTSPLTEPLLWSLAAAAWIVLVRRRQPKAQFQHLLVIGAVAGLLAAVLTALAFDTYLANQPEAAAQYAELPTSVPVEAFVLLGGLLKGALFGAVVGIIALVVDRFAPARKPAPATP